MISDQTREKLRNAAKKNNLGGNTTIQQDFTESELQILLQRYKDLDCKNTLHSLFSNKIYNSLIKWKNDVGRHLTKLSRRKLYFLIDQSNNGPTFCPHCNNQLEFESFMTTHPYTGYSKFCPSCTANRVWHQYVDIESKGQNISNAKKKFYATEKGKEVAKLIGQKNSKSLTEFFKTEKGLANIKKSSEYNSKIMKEKILSGEFTPQIRNSRTHWTVEYKGQKFRSAWEAMWYAVNPGLTYESIRIPYVHNNTEKIYIVDFEDPVKKILYEVKPMEHTTNSLSEAKILAATAWAAKTGYEYKIITQNELVDHLSDIIKSDLPDYIKTKAKKLCKK